MNDNKQCGEPHSFEIYWKKRLRTDEYWQKILIEKGKYWHNQSRKAFW